LTQPLGAWDRDALLRELQKVFDPQTAETALRVFEQVVLSLVKDEFRALREAIERLCEAHRRAEERLSRLEEGMARLEETVARLAEAQARTEARVDRLEAAVERLEAAVERLAEGQARTDRAVEKLAQEVGGLSRTVGGDLEDIGYIVVHDVLEREFGWQVGVLESTWQYWGREPNEINLFGQAVDPANPTEPIWILGEAKYNITRGEVEDFARLVKRARRHLKGRIFPVCFCYRARPEVRERIRQLGFNLVFSYGRLVPAET